MEMVILDKEGHVARQTTRRNDDGATEDILVGTERQMSELEEKPWVDEQIYCYVQDNVFNNASDEELKTYINKYYD